jgi:hypothetical protein
MNRSISLALCLLLGACATGEPDGPAANNGTTNNGTANNGTANNGTANNGTNNGTGCGDEGSPRWDRPAGTAALTLRVDDTANRTYTDGQMEWNGSFVYDDATNQVVFSASWLPGEGPYPPLYDDGPISLGGHEAEGETGCDGILSVEVWFDAAEETTVEYGLINEFDHWIWTGPNGQITVAAGTTDTIQAPGLAFPAFGNVDLLLTLDTGNLHEDYATFDPLSDRLYLKGSMISWKPVQLLDNGEKGDEEAADGIYTFQLNNYLGPHDGLLALDREAQFIFVFFDAEGLEYKKDGDALVNGVDAFSTYDSDQPGVFLSEEIVLSPESRGSALNTAVVIGEGQPPACDPPCEDGQECLDGQCVEPTECDPECDPGKRCDEGECVPVDASPPEILFIEPSRGPVTGGNPVTITGLNFAAGARVLFGESDATGVTVTDGITINCTAPPREEGTVTVQIINPDNTTGAYHRGYTYETARMVVVARNAEESTWGPNSITSVEVEYDDTNLYIWLRGQAEESNGIALYLDIDFGEGTGATNLSRDGDGALTDRDGAVDRLVNGTLTNVTEGFGAEWAFGMRGPSGDPGLRFSNDGFNDYVGWRHLFDQNDPNRINDFAWIDTSVAPIVDTGNAALLTISWETLYGGPRWDGATLALFVRVTNADGELYDNRQTLPMDDPEDPSRVARVLEIQ